jgi:DNA polymerase-3 subunit delta'
LSLRELLGQPSALAVLSSALEKGELHHALRFEGPPGVGKELAAFGVAMASACTSDDPLGCGHCEAAVERSPSQKGRRRCRFTRTSC